MSSRPNQTDSIIAGDQFIIFSANNADYRAVPTDVMSQWVKDQIPSTSTTALSMVVQRYNPNEDFFLEVENNESGTYLLLNPSTGIGSGTLKLPTAAEVNDKQQIMFTSSKQITNLTMNGNGAVVIGAPNAIAATAFFKLQYDKLSGTWYRVG